MTYASSDIPANIVGPAPDIPQVVLIRFKNIHIDRPLACLDGTNEPGVSDAM